MENKALAPDGAPIPAFNIPPALYSHGRDAPQLVARVRCSSAVVTGYDTKVYEEIAATEEDYYKCAIGLKEVDELE